MSGDTLQRIWDGELTAANDNAPRRTTRGQRWGMLASFVVSVAVGAGLARAAKALLGV